MDVLTCNVGMVVTKGELPLIGEVVEVSLLLNDHAGLVPSAKIKWHGGLIPDSWEAVTELGDLEADAIAEGQRLYRDSRKVKDAV